MMPTHILPNQLVAHHTPAQAWAYGKSLIKRFGDNVRTEDGALCREIMNLQLCILEPCNPDNWPIQGSGWDLPALEKYAEQLMSGENPSGFAYTYGERLRRYPKKDSFGEYTVDQIQTCIDRLMKSPVTRRSIAITWIPNYDLITKELPCLQLLDFLIRDNKLQCTAFFRSHDIGRAWVPNVYGIGQLMKHVAVRVGCETGSLTTISASAHIYQP